MNWNRLLVISAAGVLSTFAGAVLSPSDGWSAAELATLQSLSLSDLEPLPPDPTNAVADNRQAAALGKKLFFDKRLSANGAVSCGTCHQPDRAFQDGIALGRGVGVTAKRTMPIAATARSPFLFWDGRKDSQWAQALGPLESAVEHGGTRAQYAHAIEEHYRAEYEAMFGAMPDLSAVPQSAGPSGNQAATDAWARMTEAQRSSVTRVFVNIGKAIAAYERQIEFGPSRFDHYVAAVAAGQSGGGILSHDEIAGLRLFIGRANCTQCHNGPLFTNNEFHNTGVPVRPGLPADKGRLTGAQTVSQDEFNCRSQWSDAPERCSELDFMATGDHELDRAYKAPSLRNVTERAPYMDAGQYTTLDAVLDHYNRAPAAAAGHSELHPLHLSSRELGQIQAFLRTLSGPVVVSGGTPPEVTR